MSDSIYGYGRKTHWLADRVIIEVVIDPETRTSISLNGEQFAAVFQNVIRKGDRLDLSMLDNMWYEFNKTDDGRLNLLAAKPGLVVIDTILTDARFEDVNDEPETVEVSE